jgi:hypothetical protein
MKTPLALLSLLTISLTAGSLQAQSLLKNGDFSSGLDGWTVSKVVGTPTPGALLKAEALPDAGGKSGKSARITDEDDKAGISILQNVPAEAGKAYTLTFMSKTTVPEGQKGTPGYAMIQFLDTKGAWLNNPDAPTATGTPTPEERKLIKRDVCNFGAPGKDWQAGTVTATAPAGTTKMWIVFKAGNGGRGVIDVSDITLVPAAP